MRLRLGNLFRLRRVTVSCSRAWVLEEAAGCSGGYPQNTTHSILFLPPAPFSSPWAVVSEYRASLQWRMNPKQEESAFESPPPSDAGGKGALADCTPAPTPTEVSTPNRPGRVWCGRAAWPPYYQPVHTV